MSYSVGTPSSVATPKSPILEAEDWLYFKQNEEDKWLLKYCKIHGPFLHIYNSEEAKRMGKPDLVLILNDHLSVHKSNYRIAWCGFTTLKQKGNAHRYSSECALSIYLHSESLSAHSQ